ncbi:MAG: GTP-binding protein [Pirellula sp.]|jgi:tRNA modification GTPase|nr:GTP-binding protein [Pirellula sp.]
MHETIVTRLTSTAPAAIAVLEVRGPNAHSMIQKHWQAAHGSPNLDINRIRYGYFRTLPGENTQAGESLVVVRRGDDRFELHCHGGQAASTAIIRSLIAAGAIEESRRSWLQKEVAGLRAVEATEDLLMATTQRTASILLDQARGALDRAWNAIEQKVTEGQTAQASERCHALLRYAEVGLHLLNPWRIVLCGPPNVGKSSLLNRLLGYTRAVVHTEAGTTRDLLAESSSIDGWPVTLIDSAGVRESDHALESQGIERARQAIATADRLLLLIDPEEGWTEEHQSIWQSHSGKCLLVQTKSDKISTMSSPSKLPAAASALSAVTGDGIEELMQTIAKSLVPDPPPSGAAIPFRSWHVEHLSRTLAIQEG